MDQLDLKDLTDIKFNIYSIGKFGYIILPKVQKTTMPSPDPSSDFDPNVTPPSSHNVLRCPDAPRKRNRTRERRLNDTYSGRTKRKLFSDTPIIRRSNRVRREVQRYKAPLFKVKVEKEE